LFWEEKAQTFAKYLPYAVKLTAIFANFWKRAAVPTYFFNLETDGCLKGRNRRFCRIFLFY
jgi:hypothetical protein